MSEAREKVLENLERLNIRLGSMTEGPCCESDADDRMKRQLEFLRAHKPVVAGKEADFNTWLKDSGWETLHPAQLEIFQINVGRLCNMTCKHCHVSAGPNNYDKVMSIDTIDNCLAALDRSDAHTVDITGGAPELNPYFEYLVREARRRNKHVIFRSNLTCLLYPAFEHLPKMLADRNVEIVASLPHFRKRNTDNIRGQGTFDKSIQALKLLNSAGYGQGNAILTLMSNPSGAFLAAGQSTLETEWKNALWQDYQVKFDRLIMLNNMPMGRYMDWLKTTGNWESYSNKLVKSFNAGTISGLMCRNTVSIAYDGTIYDCDFNQMLGLQASISNRSRSNVSDFEPTSFSDRKIKTAFHCFGCTAGAGSSCGGAIEKIIK